MKWLWAMIAAFSLSAPNYFSPAGPQSSASVQPTRTVKGQTLSSSATPKVELEFDQAFKYVGTQDFILYGVARAEQYFFVDADPQRRIKRFYWAQFEGYLPSNTKSYRYKANQTVTLGGLEFIADAYTGNLKANEGRPDSDGARARAFLEGKGYRMAGDEAITQRLVHLVDEAKRNELMIIYLEVQTSGLTAADLAPGGKAAGKWEAVSAALLDRATKGMKVRR